MVSNWHMGLVDLPIFYITRINSVLHLRKLFLLCHCCLASGTLPHGPLTHPTHCLVSYHVTRKGRRFDNNFEIIVPNVHFLMLFHALHSMHCVLGITIYVLCFILSKFATRPTGRQTLSRVELLSQLSKTKPYSHSWSPVSAVIIFWKSSHFFR